MKVNKKEGNTTNKQKNKNRGNKATLMKLNQYKESKTQIMKAKQTKMNEKQKG